MSAASLAEITRLSAAERIQLAEDIWDTVAARPEDVALTEAQTQELDRRLEAYRQDPSAGASWAEVQQRVKQQNGF
jgi:putative addiction module component (TIGR02574 family)